MRVTYGIESLKQALASLGNPQDALKVITIGGTNGKGSTTNYLRAILNDSGYHVGSFTSPHLVSFHDRIRLNGKPIDDATYLEIERQIQTTIDSFELTIFEQYFIISVLYFKSLNVNYALYEVGVGGRLDAVNVLEPMMTCITHIGYDHMGLLGDTLEAIAQDKSGIMRPGVPLFTTEERVRHIFLAHLDVPVTFVEIPKYEQVGDTLMFEWGQHKMTLHQEAVYQVKNATLAATVAKALGMNENKIVNAIQKTTWPGRFEFLKSDIVIDGAHNIGGIQSLIEILKSYPKPQHVLFAALKDKETESMMRELQNHFDSVSTVSFNHPRAQSSEMLLGSWPGHAFDNSEEALKTFLSYDGLKVITGSLYYISEIRQILK